jgi:hypothetical protein
MKANQVTRTFTGTVPNCSACLTDAGAKGFFFEKTWKAAYTTNNTTGSGGSRKCTGATTLNVQNGGGGSQVLFSGGWLNANPPKFMSARKVIKKVAWIDPGVTASTDQLRLGLAYLSSSITNGAAIIVPLGPSAADSYPVNSGAYVAARQTVIDALNRNWPTGVTLPSLRNGGTPMASALVHVAQYFTQNGTYTSNFGATYELAAFKQNAVGRMNVPWVSTSTTSFCWSCQKSAVIIVTDGSPNGEALPTAIKTYDDAMYKLAANCGPNPSCSGGMTSACCSPSDGTNPPSPLPRVGAWLHDPGNTPLNDLYPTALNGKQSLMTSAVSFNLPPGKAQTILQAADNIRGGS